MLDLCQRRAAAEGFEDRCTFHHGFLETLATDHPHDAATCFLVSQFLLGTATGGMLVNADLASDVETEDYETLLPIWLDRMSSAGVPPAGLLHAWFARRTLHMP